MIIDELKEQLKQLEPDIETIKTFWQNSSSEKLYQTLSSQSEEPNFWQNPQQAEILKKLQSIKNRRENYLYITQAHKDLTDLVELFAQDEHELEKMQAELVDLKKAVNAFKVELLMSQPDDDANCFLSINAGAGGTESQDWASMLLRMYLRFCEDKKLNASIIDYQPGEEAGIKSATLFIKGKNACGLMRGEDGIHRLVRISPFDANKRRHTSFAAVRVTPEVPEVAIVINPNDLRIDTYRAGGAGGQHVNKTDSAVRITHLPTNIVVQCQNERSQTQNKATAMKMLAAKIAQKQKDEELAKQAAVEKKKIEWGSQIRSYVLHPYKMVKDHRTNAESTRPELVLDGQLIEFIEPYLLWRAQQKAAPS